MNKTKYSHCWQVNGCELLTNEVFKKKKTISVKDFFILEEGKNNFCLKEHKICVILISFPQDLLEFKRISMVLCMF